ncbi:MAG: CAAD domain-containing protein [Thermosynechococcaceae cyanobacterium]
MSTDLEDSVIYDPHAYESQREIDIISPRVKEHQSNVEIIVPETALSVHRAKASDVQDFGETLSQFIERLPEQVSAFYGAYRRPINVVGVLLLSVLTVAIASGILRVLNALPLVAPSLELVGIGYIGWFTWRYLLYAENRQELAAKYRSTKQNVLGHDSSGIIEQS